MKTEKTRPHRALLGRETKKERQTNKAKKGRGPIASPGPCGSPVSKPPRLELLVQPSIELWQEREVQGVFAAMEKVHFQGQRGQRSQFKNKPLQIKSRSGTKVLLPHENDGRSETETLFYLLNIFLSKEVRRQNPEQTSLLRFQIVKREKVREP